MQELAVISDIHGNLDALNAVMNNLSQKDIYCLGDLVGYGANPNEVIEWARERNVKCVIGNHEYALITGDVSWFNPDAQRAIFWTRSNLKRENYEFIKRLPERIEAKIEDVNALFVHGSPNDPIFEYVMPETHSDLFDYYLSRNNVNVLGLGHTHIPFLYKTNRDVIFNPGSVGQPRSRDNRASYAILIIDRREVQVEHKMVEYDIESAAKKIIKANLPGFLAQRLYIGL